MLVMDTNPKSQETSDANQHNASGELHSLISQVVLFFKNRFVDHISSISSSPYNQRREQGYQTPESITSPSNGSSEESEESSEELYELTSSMRNAMNTAWDKEKQ
jgi:hypothetical protein